MREISIYNGQRAVRVTWSSSDKSKERCVVTDNASYYFYIWKNGHAFRKLFLISELV